MTPRQRTTAVIWIVLAVGVGYDVFTFFHDGDDSTISAVVGDAAHTWPIIAGAFFLLGGHLFFPLRSNK